MKTLRVCTADVPPQPWRNGGGMTRELLARPADAHWRVRVSVADVTRDGPFSPCPGVERWFAVLDGAGIVLHLAGGARTLAPGDAPLRFAGEAAPRCTLVGGPTRDLNLMLCGLSGRLERVEAGLAWRPDAAMAGLYATASGRCSADGEAHEVPAHTLLWFDPARGAGTTTGWWVAIAGRA